MNEQVAVDPEPVARLHNAFAPKAALLCNASGVLKQV